MCELVQARENNINAILNKFTKIIENEDFNVIKDKDLKKLFGNLCHKITSRINSTKTTCAIFDAQNDKSRLIDGLARDIISKDLESDVAYFFGARESEDVAMLKNSDLNIELIENLNLRFPGEPLFLLSHDIYNSFINDIRNKTNLNLDVIILVLKSPKDLEKEDMKSFLLSVGKEYSDGNFMLVFNDSEADSCTDKDKCRKCFPKNVVIFLDSTKIRFNRRIFKVTTTKYCSTKPFENMRADLNSNTFKSFRDELDIELSRGRAVERMNKNIFKAFQVINDIQKIFDIKEIKEAINKFDLELKNKFDLLTEEINNQEIRSVEQLPNSLKKKIKNKSDKNNEISKRFIQTYKTFKDNFGKQLKDLEPSDGNIGELAKDMFDNILDTKVNNNKIEAWVNTNFKDIDLENLEEQVNDKAGLETESESTVQKFNESVEKTCKWIFSAAKETLQTLNKDFELKTVRNVDKLKKTIDKIMKEYKEEIWVNNICSSLRELKSKMSNKTEAMKVQINKILSEIEATIKSKCNTNIVTNCVGVYISTLAYKLIINSEISKIKCEIKLHLKSVPVTEFNKPFFRPFLDKMSTFTEMDKVEILFENCVYIFLGTLNDDRFYTESPTLANNQRRMRLATRLWNFVRRRQPRTKRYINESELMTEFGLLRNKLYNYLDEINDLYKTTVDDVLESGQIQQIASDLM